MPDPIVAQPAGPATPAAQPATPVPPAAAKPAVTPPPVASKPGEPPAPAPGATTVPLAALQEERDKRQQLQFELEALKKIAGQNVLFDINGHPVSTPQVAAPQNNFQVELDKLWETDPRKAVQTELMAAITWYDNVNAAYDRQEASLEKKYPDFSNYRNEVRQYVRTLPPQQRGNEGVAELAYYAIKGQNSDGITSKVKAEMEAEFMRRLQAGELAGGLPVGGVSAPPVVTGSVMLTPEQKNACAALNISEADYIKHMKT